PTARYTISLHDALPISLLSRDGAVKPAVAGHAHRHVAGDVQAVGPTDGAHNGGLVLVVVCPFPGRAAAGLARVLAGAPACVFHSDRKSTRLNSSHVKIS